MLEFLIDNGVNLNNNLYGLDALDIALNQFNLQTDKPILSLLINASSLIKVSHRQKSNQIK